MGAERAGLDVNFSIARVLHAGEITAIPLQSLVARANKFTDFYLWDIELGSLIRRLRMEEVSIRSILTLLIGYFLVPGFVQPLRSGAVDAM